jgi:hypothetical protein
VEQWANRWGAKRVVEWLTYRPRAIAWAIREFEQAIGSGSVSHDGNPVFERHVANARKRELTVRDDKERFMHTLSKDASRSPRKIDAAMAAVISWKARSDALEAGIVRLDGDPVMPPEPAPRPQQWPGGVPAVGGLPDQAALPAGFIMVVTGPHEQVAACTGESFGSMSSPWLSPVYERRTKEASDG